MPTRPRFIGAALAVAVLITVATSIDAVTARAQAACIITSVFNGTGCPINLCMYDGTGAVQCFPLNGGVIVQQIQLGTFFPVGVVCALGHNHPFIPPPNPGCTGCIALQGPAGVCCGNVCYDAATCTIRIVACPPPCN